MVNQDIVNYLAEGRKRGFSLPLLRGKLLEGGFQTSDVDEAIAFYEHQQMPPRTTLQPKPLVQQTIQQKPEVKLEAKEERSVVRSAGNEGKWMKIGAILGCILVLIHLAGIILNFVAPQVLSSLMSNGGLTLLIFAVILVLMSSLYYYAFHRIGSKTDERFLNLGAWFTIVPIIMYVILAIVAAMFVYPQTVDFFSGIENGGTYKITFLVLAILWVVALLLNLIGQILLTVGIIRTGKVIKFFNIAGILNAFVFLGGLSFLVGMVILVYSILNAFSTGSGVGYTGINQVFNQNGMVAIYSFMILFGVKIIARIFEVIGLFDASKKFE